MKIVIALLLLCIFAYSNAINVETSLNNETQIFCPHPNATLYRITMSSDKITQNVTLGPQQNFTIIESDKDYYFICNYTNENKSVRYNVNEYNSTTLKATEMRILEGSASVTKTETSSYNMTCQVVANKYDKEKNFTWRWYSKDGGNQANLNTSAGHLTIKYDNLHSILFINIVKPEDSGRVYVCEASLGNFTIQQEFKITVIGLSILIWLFFFVLAQVVIISVLVLYCERKNVKKNKAAEIYYDDMMYGRGAVRA